MALTQRSFARESFGFTLADGVVDWTSSKSEKVSEISVLKMSSLSVLPDANETVSDGRRRLQQNILI